MPAPFVHRGRVVAYVPYGLLSLQAVAARHHRDVSVLDLSPLGATMFRTSDEMADAIADLVGGNPQDVVGLSTMCSSFHHSLGVALELKRRFPRVRIWLGGPHASVHPRILLNAFEEIEAVFVGESEETFAEVLEDENTSGCLLGTAVAGVYTRDQPFLPRPQIADLDSLPPIDLAQDYLPSYQGSDDPTSSGVPVEAQRGCPGRCTFCSTRLFWGGRVRYKSDARVIREMRAVHALTGNPLFCLLGDNFAASRRRLLAFSRLAAQEIPELRWECCLTIDRLREEDLDVLWAGGCRKLFVGLESGSQNTLDRINKGIDLNRSVGLVTRALERGLAVHVSLIVGFPWESGTDIHKSYMLNRELLLQGAYSRLTTACPLPGTVLTQNESFEPGLGRSTAAFDELPHGPKTDQIVGRCPALFTQLGRFVTPHIDYPSLSATVGAATMHTSYYGRKNRERERDLI